MVNEKKARSRSASTASMAYQKRVAGMRSYWRLNGGSGKQWASVSAACWQQGITECLGCVQVMIEKGERSRSANSRADSADSRAVWEVNTEVNENFSLRGKQWAEVLQVLAWHSRAICDVIKEEMKKGAEMGEDKQWVISQKIKKTKVGVSGSHQKRLSQDIWH